MRKIYYKKNISFISCVLFFSGYYCPTGQNMSNPYTCSAGFYCPTGSFEQIKCPSGEYQDQQGQSSCKTCPAGIYNPHIKE